MRTAVIGLGNMGRALTLALARAGRPVSTWNRTQRDLPELAAVHVRCDRRIEDAVADADVILLILLSYAVTDAVLAPLAGRLKGKVLVQACSGMPDDARRFAAWAEAEGAGTLDVAIMGYPSDVTSDRILYIHAGEKALFDRLMPLLAALGPRHRHVGDEVGAAKTYDNILLARSWSWMLGYLQAAAMARAAGLDTTEFTEISMGLLGPLFGNIDRASKEIATGRFAPAREASLAVHHKAAGVCVQLARQWGAEVPILEAVEAIMASTIARGLGDRELAACFTEFDAGRRT